MNAEVELGFLERHLEVWPEDWRCLEVYDEAPLISSVQEPGIWYLVGTPGAGKTTFSLAAQARGRHAVLMDEIRRAGGWSWSDRAFVTDAYEIAYAQMRENVQRGTLVDSTGTYFPALREAEQICEEEGLPLRIIVLKTPVRTAWERSLRKKWDQPNMFFHLAHRVHSMLEVDVRMADWTTLHCLDPAAQARLYASWGVDPVQIHLERSTR